MVEISTLVHHTRVAHASLSKNLIAAFSRPTPCPHTQSSIPHLRGNECLSSKWEPVNQDQIVELHTAFSAGRRAKPCGTSGGCLPRLQPAERKCGGVLFGRVPSR